MAGKKDIAAMKIHALEDRGAKRDFIDTYFLAKEYTLDEMLKFYNQKYKVLEDRLVSITKSLSYFDDAELGDWEAKMLTPIDWEAIKSFFKKETLRLSKSLLKIKN